MLEIKNISYSIIENERKVDILKDVSFCIENDKIIILTGHNGSGKSTLAKIIMGILKPTSGSIVYNGIDVTNMSINERANLGISFAFQQPIHFKGLTVKDLLDISAQEICSVSSACEYLSKVGLCAKEYIYRQLDNKLSGGELKRIEIASVLARNTKLNIFDEPEAGIDIWSFDTLINLFKNNKSTNLIISHQHKLIDIADKILLLKNGEILKFGTKEEVIPYLHNNQCERLKGEENG